jgi:hypothetical protein
LVNANNNIITTSDACNDNNSFFHHHSLISNNKKKSKIHNDIINLNIKLDYNLTNNYKLNSGNNNYLNSSSFISLCNVEGIINNYNKINIEGDNNAVNNNFINNNWIQCKYTPKGLKYFHI